MMAQTNASGNKIQTSASKTAVDLTVVGGAGHVGIPLVLSFAKKGLCVMINDLSEQAIAQLQAGSIPFIEYGAEELLREALAKDRLVFSTSNREIPSSGPVILTIGTPVDEFLNPALKFVKTWSCAPPYIPAQRTGLPDT
jgi:UDP-N-acetyl-D-mannosaminuronic acid dehydrogenase